MFCDATRTDTTTAVVHSRIAKFKAQCFLNTSTGHNPEPIGTFKALYPDHHCSIHYCARCFFFLIHTTPTVLATGWTVRGSNPVGGEIFCTCPDRPKGPPSLLYNGYRVFPGGKERPVRDADPSVLLVPWSRKSRTIPLLPLWAVRPVQGCTLPLPYTDCVLGLVS